MVRHSFVYTSTVLPLGRRQMVEPEIETRQGLGTFPVDSADEMQNGLTC